jgi:hypothetical protein
MFPIIVCIAKKEHDYIEEFVKYHLAIGFSHIFIYDNEDQPTYDTLLHKYIVSEQVSVIHFPGNNSNIGVQYIALHQFMNNIINDSTITHVAHIDIDEYIVLKKHATICDFIQEYIVGDCAGIGMNWRFFGSSNHTEKSSDPMTQRFTMCEQNGNEHIKTLFKKEYYHTYNTVHDIVTNYGQIYSTNGSVIHGPCSNYPELSVIQLNHYKCKTLPEFRFIRERGRADMSEQPSEDVEASFRRFDMNEVEDLTAKEFYARVLERDARTGIYESPNQADTPSLPELL